MRRHSLCRSWDKAVSGLLKTILRVEAQHCPKICLYTLQHIVLNIPQHEKGIRDICANKFHEALKRLKLDKLYPHRRTLRINSTNPLYSHMRKEHACYIQVLLCSSSLQYVETTLNTHQERCWNMLIPSLIMTKISVKKHAVWNISAFGTFIHVYWEDMTRTLNIPDGKHIK